MKTLIYLIFFCLFFTKGIQADLEWHRWVQESDTLEICKVKQDYAFKKYYTKRDNRDVWLFTGTANFIEGEHWGVKYKEKDTFKQKPSFINGNVVTRLDYPVDDDSDKIELINGHTKKLKKDELFECYKNNVVKTKINFDSYNVFTQNDLFNGLSDNKKISAYGFLEIPKFKECKGIKKYPVMFLIHHSGGSIMTEYKYYLQRNCIATFEPKIFFSRGSNRNEFDPDADIQWTTITQGAVDSLMAIDVIANNKQIDSSKIGIMGWSYGGSVSVETQNMFNLDVIKPKNQFALHLAYYTYCYQYENTNTTDAPLTIFSPKGDKGEKTRNQVCHEWIKKISVNKPQKQIVDYENALHNFDGQPIKFDSGTVPDSQCRLYTDNNGNEWVLPDDTDFHFNITENGGWYGREGDSIKRARARKYCWEFDSFEAGRNQEAYEDSWARFTVLVDKYLSPSIK